MGVGLGIWENGFFDYYDFYNKVKDFNSGYVCYWDGDVKVFYVYNEF